MLGTNQALGRKLDEHQPHRGTPSSEIIREGPLRRQPIARRQRGACHRPDRRLNSFSRLAHYLAHLPLLVRTTVRQPTLKVRARFWLAVCPRWSEGRVAAGPILRGADRTSYQGQP